MLYTALIGYLYGVVPEEDRNFAMLVSMINAMEVREDDEDFKNPVDLMFEALEEREPEHFAVRQYKKYKLAGGMTMQEVVDLLRDEHGWSDSVSNLSNKLQRESLRYVEAVQLADALGYEIIWQKRR